MIIISNQKYYPGDSIINHQGFTVTIIDRINGQKHNNLLVEFNDAEKTRIYCDIDSFKNCTVKNPKFKRGKDNRIIINEKERVGMENVNYLNEKIKVIAYRSAQDIDVEFQDEYKGVVTTTWAQFKKGHVKNPNQLLTGIVKHPSNFEDLCGQIFNDLLVLYWDTDPPNTERIKGNATGLWKCLCMKCGEFAWANTDELKDGRRKSCRECGRIKKSTRRYKIKYDLSGEYGIGYTYNTNKEFYFDLEDYDLIKDFSWKENTNGYIVANKNNREILMHRLILGVTDKDQVVDHIKHNVNDNRKSMLRITTTQNNTRNEVLAINNTSGKTGVCWEPKSNCWHAYIWVGKSIHLGRFINKEDAIEARLKAEEEYFGEYSYDNSIKIGDMNERNNF